MSVLPAEVLQLLLHVKGAVDEVRVGDNEVARRDSENQRAIPESEVWSQEVDDGGLKFEMFILEDCVLKIDLAQGRPPSEGDHSEELLRHAAAVHLHIPLGA